MKLTRNVVAAALTACFMTGAYTPTLLIAAEKSEYRIGDRLRKDLAQRFEQFLVVHEALRLGPWKRLSGGSPLSELVDGHGGDDDRADDDLLDGVRQP